jgi:hypothetical protein
MLQVLECNCSICTKAGYLHLVVPADPNSRSVNVHCLDPGTVEGMTVGKFNGRQWGRA